MAATGNTDPFRREAAGHHQELTWVVTATGVTSFTIQTPFVGQYFTVTATSGGTALTAQPSVVFSTGIITVTGVTSGDVVVVTASN